MDIDKDSFLNGVFLAIIWFLPVMVTTSILSETLVITLLSGIITFVIALIFSIPAVPLSDKIFELIAKKALRLVRIIGKDDRIVLFAMIAVGDVVSVLIPVLVFAFVL